MRALVRLAIGLLVLAAAAPAVGQDATNAQEGTKTLQPRIEAYHPAPQPLKKGDAVNYDWTVQDPPGARLRFTAHLHIGATLINYTDVTLDHLQGKLTADRDGLYSLYWDNDVNNFTVTFHYRYETLLAPPEGKPTPDSWWVAAAGSVVAAIFAARRPR